MNKLFLLTLLSALIFISCDPESKKTDNYVPKGIYDSGVLVLNEGNFGIQYNNASISYLSYDLNYTENDIFASSNNNLNLGNTAQSISFSGEMAYVVVNGSSKIEVINRYTMVKIATITDGLINPRYIAFANGKGYVTDWGKPSFEPEIPSIPAFVAVINLNSNTVSSTIPVISDPEKIVSHQGKLYVAHYGFGYNNKLSIIDSNNNTVIGTPITVGDGPKDLQIENDNLWISCEGQKGYPTPSEEIDLPAKIFKISLNTLQSTIYKYNSNLKHISHFQIYNSNAYYTINNEIYKFALTGTSLPTVPIFTSDANNLYGFAVSNNRIYVGDAKGFNSNGSVFVYSLGEISGSQNAGVLLKTVETGIAPNGFYFNQ